MLELNKIYCADCLELMKEIDDKSIDLVLTDPPYGIWMSKWTYLTNTKKWITANRKFDSDTRDDKIPEKEYFDEIIRISKMVFS
jgi:DNA modification methylase